MVAAPLCEQPPVPAQPSRRGRPSIAEAEQISGKILDASWDVLLEEGFESFTFDRVARRARIGKATIYSRFANKSELLHALLWQRTHLRRAFILAQGADLPLVEAFALRATEVIMTLASPDGQLVERLMDWLDLEKGGAQGNVRARVYCDAVEAIAESFVRANERGGQVIPDPRVAAQFWVEGLMGHARMAIAQCAVSRAETERWALGYARFFFAGVEAFVAR